MSPAKKPFFFFLETKGSATEFGCLKFLQCLSSQHLLCANVIPPAVDVDVSSCACCVSYRVSIGHPNEAITRNMLLGSESMQCKQGQQKRSVFAAAKERRGYTVFKMHTIL